MKERTKIEEELEQIVQKNGAENTLWTLVRTLSTDKLEDLVTDIKWAIGEQKTINSLPVTGEGRTEKRYEKTTTI